MSKPPDRECFTEILARLNPSRNLIHHLGLDDRREHRVHAYPVARQLPGRFRRKGQEPRLARRVVRSDRASGERGAG